MTLKVIPEDVLKYILKIQYVIKTDKKIGQFSMESTVYKIIRDHEKAHGKTV